MEDLTFGEQVKIILSRKGMTIKELAELIEDRTGKKMSRQNLTQRLGRDNFQEQDMRMIAAILGCPFQLSIFPLENAAGEKTESMEELLLRYVKHPRVQPRRKKTDMEDGVYQQVLVFDKDPGPEDTAVKKSKPEDAVVKDSKPQDAAEEKDEGRQESIGSSDMEELELDVLDAEDSEDLEESETMEQAGAEQDSVSRSSVTAAEKKEERTAAEERDMTIGELYDIHKELSQLTDVEIPVKGADSQAIAQQALSAAPVGTPEKKEEPSEEDDFEPVIQYDDAKENLELGEMNPYTGREYQTNSVRMHPTRLGYVQVYDRHQHGWTDMTEWAFLGYQERKKALLGRDYEPPIYLD